jgi:N-acyl-D-aspartate/D-glutamate deacylase
VKDLLIRGGHVVDGTGSSAVRADVRVDAGRIVEVGPSLRPYGETHVDASGAFVTPGFIDSHTHLDPTLFWDPLADPMPQHGVTSVVIGNCALGLAPLHAADRAELVSLFAYIEDIPAAAFELGVPFDWEGFDEYLASTSRGGLGLNAAVLVSHNALRAYVIGPEAWDRAATSAEVEKIGALLGECLRAGGVGLATTYFDVDESGRPVPARHANDAERVALIDVLARHGGCVQFLPRSAGDPIAEIEHVASLCGPRGVTAVWNGLYQTDKFPTRNVEMLAQATRLRDAGVSIWPQVSPRTVDFRINWDRSMAFMEFPNGWQRFVRAGPEEKRRLLQDPAWRSVARTEWDSGRRAIFPTGWPEKIRLVDARPENRRWIGKTLADLGAEVRGHLSDVLADWLLANDLDAGVVIVGVGNSDVDAVAEMICHPATMIGASDAGAHVAMQCAFGDTTLLFTRHVRERGDLTIEEAVRALTSVQAQVFGLHDRGVVRPGAHADLTIFDLDELRWEADEFAYDLPDGSRRLRRPEGGYRATIVGGVPTQIAGKLTGSRPGGVIH